MVENKITNCTPLCEVLPKLKKIIQSNFFRPESNQEGSVFNEYLPPYITAVFQEESDSVDTECTRNNGKVLLSLGITY